MVGALSGVEQVEAFPQPAQQVVQRIAGGMSDAGQGEGELEFARIGGQETGRGRDPVDQEGAEAEDGGEEKGRASAHGEVGRIP